MSNPKERENVLGVIIFAPTKQLCEVGHIAYTITECVASHLTRLLFKTNPIKYISCFCVVESYEIFLLYSSAFVQEFFIPPYLITSNQKMAKYIHRTSLEAFFFALHRVRTISSKLGHRNVRIHSLYSLKTQYKLMIPCIAHTYSFFIQRITMALF